MKTIQFLALAALLTLSAENARSSGRQIYPGPSQAKADIAAALKTAAISHKRILLDFGGNWCPDCQVLDIYFHDTANRPILEANFVLVHVNIGMVDSNMDANLDLAQKYEIPLKKGVPALAVLSDQGKLLYSQKSGEFEAMGRMDSSAVTRFLMQWKPLKPGCSAVMVNC
jgi:thiol-disulfide isomerase/thioredoxin